MADPNEPEKETVRIPLPPQPVAKPGTDTRSRETVRIQLPPRQPSNKVPPSFPTEPSVPLEPSAAPSPPPPPVFSPESPTKIPTPEPDPGAPPPVSAAPDLTSLGPKKETARIALMPEPPARPAPAVQMKKTQPLIPMPTCWTLLGVSAVILIIQIWTYFS